MLGLVLLTSDEGRLLELTLARMASAITARIDVTLVDRGSQDGTLERLAAFAEEHGARLLPLEAPEMDLAGALEAARAAGAPEGYLLGLTGQDLLCAGALAPLAQMLGAQRPDLVICAQDWWLAGQAPLAAADAAELASQALADRPDPARLRADPRRLLPAPSLLAARGPLRSEADAGVFGAWVAHDAWLAAAERVLVYPVPVMLRPLPKVSLQSLFSGLSEVLSTRPKGAARTDFLDRTLLRIGMEMRFADPEEALADVAAAAELWRGLSRVERRLVMAMPGPVGALMTALEEGGRRHGRSLALAVLAQQVAAEDRRRVAALTAEIRGLRADLDLALPGPEYLRGLYERLRGL